MIEIQWQIVFSIAIRKANSHEGRFLTPKIKDNMEKLNIRVSSIINKIFQTGFHQDQHG